MFLDNCCHDRIGVGLLSIAAIAIATACTLLDARPALAGEPFYLVITADGPPVSAGTTVSESICVPSSFDSDDLQPITRSPPDAVGYCSDAIGYQAVLDEGQVVFEAETEPPFTITLLPGTDVTYLVDAFGTLPLPCDAETIGSAVPPVSPCRFLGVRITESSSFWMFEDGVGNLQFSLPGTTPVARLPEPAFALGLGVALLFLAIAGRERTRRSCLGHVA